MKDRINRLEDLVLGLIQKRSLNLTCMGNVHAQAKSQNAVEGGERSGLAPSDQAKEDASSQSPLDYRSSRIRDWVLSNSTAYTEVLF
ncbi:hypothetical protein N7478_005989 [Penicillium angulare]|uniref:uncharacterized protein n=1 Tax=Penicillium angulare TaxID=116970 RepID=UPI00254059FD|nr:uncharacterized protein N7478_005989 [Penicillium angulare]KAJ5280617.1 hypothetical protein N7478_005989 [Penicillium angulare]